jgi:Ca2+-binding EF-hand superfamily protein
MVLAIGAASAIDIISSLAQSATSSKKPNKTSTFDDGSSTQAANTVVPTGPAPQSGQSAGTGNVLSPDTYAQLLAAQNQSADQTQTSQGKSDAFKDLFSKLDSNGNGQISKTEFEASLGAGGTNVKAADSVFGKLDQDGNGSVSASELGSILKSPAGGGHSRHHGAGGSKSGGGGTDALLQALDGSSSSVSNSDGSTSTTVTYADGSKVTLTSPPSSATSGSAASSYNSTEQAVQSQANALSTSGASALSVHA